MEKILGITLATLLLAGCGTENPFSRGIETAGGGDGGPITGDVSFATNVVPALRGCPSCHSAGAGGWTYAGGAGAFSSVTSVIDTGSPANSLLLIKATGGAGHDGGTIFAASSSSYATILTWIEQGAREN